MATRIRQILTQQRRPWLLGLLLSVALVLQLWLLKELPYSRAWFTSIPAQHALSPDDPLSLAGFSWHPERYLAATSLEPLRAAVRQHCPGLNPTATGSCLENLFARRFPHGRASGEFFDRAHDPAGSFTAHLAGEAGDCVTRSGMLAAAMLAVGMPARVVQLIRPDGRSGHNVAEIWDGPRGWVLIDPSYAGILRGPDGRISALAAAQPGSNAHWERDESVPIVSGVVQNNARYHYDPQDLGRAVVLYPDPWLYTRVGNSHAPLLFTGHFVRIGPRSGRIGVYQSVLQLGIPLTAAGLLALVARSLIGALAYTRQRALPSPARAAEAPPVEPSS